MIKRSLAPTLLFAGLGLTLAGCHSGPVIATYDGTYTGTATLTASPALNCPSGGEAAPMTVQGGRVSVGTFRGWVNPDGSVHMLSSVNQLDGLFSGSGFSGNMSIGAYNIPGIFCTYTLSFARQ